MLANLHMQFAASNSGYLEYMYDPGFWNPEGFQAGFAAPYPVDAEGNVHAPSQPGLGAPWDREFIIRRNVREGKYDVAQMVQGLLAKIRRDEALLR